MWTLRSIGLVSSNIFALRVSPSIDLTLEDDRGFLPEHLSTHEEIVIKQPSDCSATECRFCARILCVPKMAALIREGKKGLHERAKTTNFRFP